MNDRDEDMIVRTLMGEAGGESDAGKAAVAHVILNRLKTGAYGDSASKVVLAPNQFEPWSTRAKELRSYDPKSEAYQSTKAIVDGVLAGKIDDPTGGATHFYSPGMQAVMNRPTPSWAKGDPMATIGHHVFYAPEGPAQEDLLANWGKNSQAPATTEGSGDLLSDWAQKVTPAATTAPPTPPVDRIVIHPATAQPTAQPATQDPETLPQYVNKLVREHQGDSYSDEAIRLGAGALRGVGDVGDTIGLGIAGLGRMGANALQNTGIISPQTNTSVQNWANGVDARALATRNEFDALSANSPLAQTGRVGGQIAATAPALGAGEAALGLRGLMATRPLLGSVVTGATAGAGANALTSSASDEPLSQQMMGGAEAGALLGPLGEGASLVGRGVRNVLFGGVSPETAALADTARNVFGIPVTAGQISSSPASRFMDSVLQRLPFTGYGARTAEQQVAFNRAVANTFGENADRITPQVMQNARDRIGQAFDDVAARTGTIQVDHPFIQRLNNIWNDVQAVLPQSEQAPLQRQLRDMMSARDPATNTFSAETYQALTRKGAPLDRLSHSADPNIRHYASQIREALDDVMQRSAPPDAVQDLLEARRQWRAMKTVEPIATSKKAPSGDISPARLATQAEKSYPRGNGPMSDLGRIGQRFLTEPNSSGTAERLASMKALGSGLGILGGIATGEYAFDPEHFQRNALLTGGALLGGRLGSAALRSNWLADSLINAALYRPGGPNPLTNLLTRAAPVAALTSRPTNALAGQ